MIVRFVIAAFLMFVSTADAAQKKDPKQSLSQDWGTRAEAELEASRIEVPKAPKTAKSVGPVEPAASTGAQPTAATIQAEVAVTQSVIERTALRFTFLFEPYQPNGTATLGSGERITYSSLPTSVLGQVDLRWLPFEFGEISGRLVTIGGYAAGGFSRQQVPLVAPSGFRFDDVALNSLRFEAGVASGIALGSDWIFEARLGFGRASVVQTSRYPDVVGSFARPYIVGALDLSYYLGSRFALVASVARRSPLGDGSGSLAFDPLTVSGGFLVQVR